MPPIADWLWECHSAALSGPINIYLHTCKQIFLSTQNRCLEDIYKKYVCLAVKVTVKLKFSFFMEYCCVCL